MQRVNYNILKNIEKQYGEGFYLIDTQQFKKIIMN